MIPDEAVEAVARKLWVLADGYMQDERPSWDEVIVRPAWKESVEVAREDARELLEAAAPHMMAAIAEPGSAMREAMNLAWHEGYGAGKSGAPFVSPYRKPTDA